ncbi:MAG: spore maturation protein SpmA/spore maturation protein SpmB [Parvicella sp.]
MVLNYIWISFFILAFIIAIVRTLLYYFRDSLGLEAYLSEADKYVFQDIVQSTFDMSEASVTIAIFLVGTMTLWLGIMKIGEKGGAIDILSKFFRPLFSRIFPEVPRDHPAHGSIVMNFTANMLGLDNAATPAGLKAMEQLQEVNPDKTTASNSQIMFLVLNTSGLTLIPISVLALRASENSVNPAEVFIPILLATYFSTMIGLITVSIWQKINLFNKVILAYLGGVGALVAGIIYGMSQLNSGQISSYSTVIGNGTLFFIIAVFIWLGVRKKQNIYENFIEGAVDGFSTSIKIIPYLLAMLVGIGVFRASGGLDYIVAGLSWFFSLFFYSLEFVDSLTVAFMKPLSGSGARGAFMDVVKEFGVDSFRAKIAATLQGSTETTFYVLAVYFGSVGIRNSRYAVTAGLLADLGGIIAAIIISYMMYPH